MGFVVGLMAPALPPGPGSGSRSPVPRRLGLPQWDWSWEPRCRGCSTGVQPAFPPQKPRLHGLGWSHGGVNQEGNDGRARPSPAPGWSGSLGLLCSGPAPRGSARVQHRSPVLGRRGPCATACPSPWGSSAVSVALPGDRGAEPLPAGPPVSFTPSPHSVSLGTERGAVVLWGHRDRAHSAGERRSGSELWRKLPQAAWTALAQVRGGGNARGES